MAGAVAMSDAVLLALQWTNMAATSGKARHALAYAGVVMIQASEAVNNGATEASCEDLYAEALAIIDKVASAGHGRAEFNDEPLPFQGLRPEITDGYRSIWQDMSSKPEDLLAFAKANGFSIDPAQTRTRYADRAKTKRPSDKLE